MCKTELLTLNEAASWASEYLNINITTSNISYLLQYGKVKNYIHNNSSLVNKSELLNYYESYRGKRELHWKSILGKDLNWGLSFDNLREKDTTKHIHRIHPYKGKFIPQLVEYFIDDHIDDFKKHKFFEPGDIILDPFLGSGTTLVQANELNIHGIGIDISEFNCLISKCKLQSYNPFYLERKLNMILDSVINFESDKNINEFEDELLFQLAIFNKKYFPSPNYKYDLNHGKIDELNYPKEKEKEFLRIYLELIRKFNIKLHQENDNAFLNKWYLINVRDEIEYVKSLIEKEEDTKVSNIFEMILSRTMRSCRATTHSDLATLKKPQFETYYCFKHKKICKPIFSIKKMFNRYALDTIKRIDDFGKIKTQAYFSVFSGDSRTININDELKNEDPAFYKIFKQKKIAGIFTSPPYVGQIDYHEQHAYAYELFEFKRRDNLEIGPLYKGKGIDARKSYIQGVSNVLANSSKYLSDDFNIFIVANDKFNLYPKIAEKSDMRIINQYKRPVLNRTERDRNPYSESIFHLKKK